MHGRPVRDVESTRSIPSFEYLSEFDLTTLSHSIRSNNSSPPSAAFGRTMQFITSVKLQEQKKQRLSYGEHSKAMAEADAAGYDLPRKVEILLETVRSWSGSGALIRGGVVGTKLDL